MPCHAIPSHPRPGQARPWSGLEIAKYLSDAGHKPIVYEAQNVLGVKVSIWQDKDRDWVETGLHICFGAYPNMMNLFLELDSKDQLQWKPHQMTFAMVEKPGQITSFNCPTGIPTPFNMAAAILINTEMLTLEENWSCAYMDLLGCCGKWAKN
jgi:15-cis-phytoene desaturase